MSIFDKAGTKKANKPTSTCNIKDNGDGTGLATIEIPLILDDSAPVSSTGKTIVLGASGSQPTGLTIQNMPVKFNGTVTVAIPKP